MLVQFYLEPIRKITGPLKREHKTGSLMFSMGIGWNPPQPPSLREGGSCLVTFGSAAPTQNVTDLKVPPLRGGI